jgi:ATP-dependent protease Clp ATPase subunit
MMSELHCSFCQKPARRVARLIAGPDGLHICDGCVGLLCDIIAEGDAKWRKRRLKRLLARDARGP